MDKFEYDAYKEYADYDFSNPYELCFGNNYARTESTGIRAAFNYYTKRGYSNRNSYVYLNNYYQKVMYDANGVNIIFYTSEEVFNWDPVIKTIIWSEPNCQYDFQIPYDCEHGGKWKTHLGNCVYGTLIAHRMYANDLIDILGCTPSHAKRICGGVSDMTARESYIFAKRFGMSFEELVRI